jgi:hypothetical protein
MTPEEMANALRDYERHGMFVNHREQELVHDAADMIDDMYEMIELLKERIAIMTEGQ